MQPVSSSNTPADTSSSASAEKREAAANNPPRRKRRRMATGHGVQQIPETSIVLLPPQQQEQPTLPFIEQRHVAEHQSAATSPFASAEPTETDRPELAVAFAEAPIAAEPMEIEAGPAAGESPLDDIIVNFLPQHQEKIRECLNDEYVQQILSAVRNFLTLLRESGIKLTPGRGRIPTPSLFGCLRSLTLPKDAALVRKFFEKATVFFSAVNPAQTKNTGCLSTMLYSNTHITKFANETEDNLRLLAGNPYLKQITSMCSRRGVPDPVKAAEIIEWDCWKIDDTFCLELLRTFSSMHSGRGLINDQAQVVEMLVWECWQQDGEFSMELLRTVSSMMNHRGFPDKDTLTAMLVWDCWKVDGKFSIELLRIFSSMMHGFGIPQKEQVEAILAWPCWQVDGKFSFDLLRTFSSMSHSRGLIKQAEVERVLAWPCWQVNGKFSLDLLRIFSSMTSGRGLLKDEARINATLAWECWKIEDEFSIDLLRTVASMLRSRGLPKKEPTENLLSWPCWQVDGKFNIELLRIFSSMMSGCGIPQKEKVEAILAWPCWQVEGKFSFDLLRTFSSMSTSRGLIQQAEVELVLAWPCWQINGKFSLDLLRIFSSMSSGRGLLKDEAQINAVLAWECWKIEGEFSIDLLRTVASMMSGRGLFEKEPTENFLLWPCWQVDGKFSLELLRIFSSMKRSRGLLDNEAHVQAILAWDCWKRDGKLSIKLLRTFSSMHHGKGLFKDQDQNQIKAILAWPCWQVKGEFSPELLRTFAPMKIGRGLFDRAQVEQILAWDCWKLNGEFSLELLRIFSLMMNSQGLFDDEAPIKTILAWDCWKVGGEFSLPLLRTIASMMAGRGLLKKAPVGQLLSWPCWQVDGKFNLKLLQFFSVMMIGRGLLNQMAVEAFMAWLPSDHITRDKEQTCLKVACQLFTRAGLPDPKILADIEATLRRYIPEEAIVSDEEESSDNEDEPQEMVQIKALTLFCAAPAKRRTSIAGIEQFLVAHNTANLGQKAVCATLDSLLQILANHGQAGLRFWLKYYSDNLGRKHALTRALLISAPLAHTKYALTQLPESEWPEYIELCKNLTPAPNKDQWQALKPLRDLLHRRFTLTLRKRMMLEILWPQSEHNRLRYADKLDTLLNTVPTIYQLYRLRQAFKPQKLQAFLDACLARENMAGQSINETLPEIKTQELLLEGLLLSNHYLSGHGQIPDLCFSKQVAGADGSGVIVDGDAEMLGHQRLWHFIAAMLIELNQTEYQFKRQQLRISPPDSEPIVLPKPEFTGTDTGFVITNWSPEQLTAFFRATEFTEYWYKNPDDTRDISTIRREQRLLQMRVRPQNTTQTGYKAGHNSSRSLLSPSVIINIIKQGLHLKPTVWSSLEHYAKNGQLSDTLCQLLAPIIEKELASTAPDAIPEIVKKTVAQRLRQTGTSQTAAVATATQLPSSTSTFAATPSPYASPLMSPSQTLPATQDVAIDMALDAMARDMAIEELEHFPVLGRAELAMLEPWRDQMTYSQLMDVMTKIDLQSVEQATVLTWQQTFENRRREPLGLDLDEFLDSMLEGTDEV